MWSYASKLELLEWTLEYKFEDFESPQYAMSWHQDDDADYNTVWLVSSTK